LAGEIEQLAEDEDALARFELDPVRLERDLYSVASPRWLPLSKPIQSPHMRSNQLSQLRQQGID
jgi:hypothetical protein